MSRTNRGGSAVRGEVEVKAIGHGVYSLTEAASFTHLRRDRVGEWFQGRSGAPNPRPVFRSDYEVVDGVHSISFLDLVEVFIPAS